MPRRSERALYLWRRFLLGMLTFAGVTGLVFTIGHLAPGDPVTLYLDVHAAELSLEAREALRSELTRELGLDRSLPEQYACWMADLCRLDLGRSLAPDRRKVSRKILERLPGTLLLGSASLFLVFAVSLPLGLLFARHQGQWPDRLGCAFLDLLYAAPYFWVAVLAQYALSVKLGWLPFGGSASFGLDQGSLASAGERLLHMILPASLLAYGSLAFVARFTRGVVLESAGQTCVALARAHGLPGRKLLTRTLRMSILALIPLGATALSGILAGSIVIETLFSWPGLGQLFVEAVRGRDYPLVQALSALSALIVLASHFAADLAMAWADPRISFGAKRS